MRILEALAILESAVLECKKRDINTPEVKAALDLLERYIWPKWVIPQFRHHLENQREPLEKREGQQQVLRATFPGIRNCVRELLGVRADDGGSPFAASVVRSSRMANKAPDKIPSGPQLDIRAY